MFNFNGSAVHFNRPARPAYRTPRGEDDYYRHHSFALPRPFAQLRARFASLQLTAILHRPPHGRAPVVK